MYIRSLSASATDGRWEWFESGTPFRFEETERYQEQRIRDRFDREMLLRYLSNLGVPVEDRGYGAATLHQVQVDWGSREVTLTEAKAEFGR